MNRPINLRDSWRRRTGFLALAGLMVFALCRADEKDKAAEAKAVTFEKAILPILEARCFECHSGDKPKAQLDLSGLGSILKGGKKGAAIRIGAAESSLLWVRIAGDEMPKEGAPLTAEEKGMIRTWINDGAKGAGGIAGGDGQPPAFEKDDGGGKRDHWSFQPPKRPPLPETGEPVENGIDAFVLARLEEEKLTMSPEADRRTLIRRLSYDLIGLPPTPEEVAAFVADADEGAYERLVDRLLESPHYGERWGRHWLDVAGYADSAGILNEDKVLPLAWRYRDYVIRAFNDDKPYDRFLQEQIAGDELTDYWTADATLDRLPEQVVEGVTATGYLRCAADASRPDFKSIKNAAALYFYQTLDDTLRIVGSSTMGLTLHCAKCHSHLYDPIPQTDYYRMQAIFMPAYRPTEWVPQMERRLPIATASQRKVADAHNGKIDTAVKKLQKKLGEVQSPFKNRLLEKRLAELPEADREPVRMAFATSAAERTDEQKKLFEKHKAKLQPAAAALEKALTESFPEYKKEADPLNQSIAAEEGKRIKFDEIRALYDLPGEVETPFLRRGDPLTPGAKVEPGVLTALTTGKSFDWKAPPEKDAKTSGRRLAFARWLTQPNHPLTGRVMVNRVWLHHFGEGLVRTPEDFGHSGEKPSHPELMDWLTREFIDNGWSVKDLHRSILTSRTYRQRSVLDESRPVHLRALKIDPDNRLLWRQRMRRLEAEPMRDAVLAVAGTLNPEMFGEPVGAKRLPTGEVTPSVTGAQAQRRSIYLRTRRSEPVTVLQAFDQPVMETNCVRRNQSTVSTQALTLMNSDFMGEAATDFASRTLREQPDNLVERAVELAFSRKVNSSEQTVLQEFLKAQTARHVKASGDDARHRAMTDLCHLLLSANEFAYVD